MEVDVTTKFTPWDFGATGTKEILQNVRMILATESWSAPLDRDFAWIPDALDRPQNVAQAILAQQLVQAVRKYEPRAQVTKITFDSEGDSINGQLKPIVRVVIPDGAAI